MHAPPIPETPLTKAIVVGLCVYESVAICTGRVPTLTALDHRHPAVGIAIVGALALHFWTPAPI